MRIKRELLSLIRSLKCCTVLGYWLRFEPLEEKCRSDLRLKWWRCSESAWKTKLKEREGIYIVFSGDTNSSVYIGSSENVKKRLRLHLSSSSTGMCHLHRVLEESYVLKSCVWVLVLKIGRLRRTKVSLSEIEKKVYEVCLKMYGVRCVNKKSPEVKKPGRRRRGTMSM